jgi:hypothetical protein
VPDRMIGAVLGKGGAVLREIQAQSGARITISKRGEFAPGTTNRWGSWMVNFRIALMLMVLMMMIGAGSSRSRARPSLRRRHGTWSPKGSSRDKVRELVCGLQGPRSQGSLVWYSLFG